MGIVHTIDVRAFKKAYSKQLGCLSALGFPILNARILNFELLDVRVIASLNYLRSQDDNFNR